MLTILNQFGQEADWRAGLLGRRATPACRVLKFDARHRLGQGRTLGRIGPEQGLAHRRGLPIRENDSPQYGGMEVEIQGIESAQE
jgi:hypothetical protein